METKLSIQRKVKKVKENIWTFVIAIIFVSSIVSGFLVFFYNEAKEDLERNFDIEIGNFSKLKSDWLEEKEDLEDEKNKYIRLKDETQRELDVCKINSGKFNLTINNKNILDNGVEYILNTSCIEKDIVIGELIEKANEQEKALQLLKNENSDLNDEINDLKVKIPEYEKGFVGEDIKVSKGASFQANNGKFILSVISQNAYSNLNKYDATFRINGIQYTKNLGQQVVFNYIDGFNYTLNLRGTSNPVTFYIYKNE